MTNLYNIQRNAWRSKMQITEERKRKQPKEPNRILFVKIFVLKIQLILLAVCKLILALLTIHKIVSKIAFPFFPFHILLYVLSNELIL